VPKLTSAGHDVRVLTRNPSVGADRLPARYMRFKRDAE
jgi:uncharacterized protein YbjT (DUF2867 family)